MKSKEIVILVLFILAIAVVGIACVVTFVNENKENVTNAVYTTANNNEAKVENTVEKTEEKKPTRVVDTIDYRVAAEKQMAKPEKGDTIAIIKVKGYGEIKAKFFEDKAPKAVENFLTHAKEGYYDGVIFHRVIEEFMIQGGDPLGTGRGGESIWGQGFAEELDFELVPYRGALSMASSGKGTSSLGSQFYIVQGNYNTIHESELVASNFPKGLIEEYKKYGGYPTSLYLNYTIFGQVYEGMDVVDKIAKVVTNPENDKPLTDVVIEKITVTEY